MSLTAEENIQLVKDFFANLSTGDLDTVRPLLHEDATWEAMAKKIPGTGKHVGHKGILDDFLGPVRGLFEDGDPKVFIKTIISQGDLVAAETEAKGKFRNGKDYHNLYCWMIEIKDGKVFYLREYMDSHYVMGIVGD